ncbi:MAG: hemolysin family protein [Candidatus Kapabacteria bacterium]|nr:hemolysin family protein [Candidatus Kapabacteria bacterium]
MECPISTIGNPLKGMLGGILLTAALVLLNAFFVAAEFALVKVREAQLQLELQRWRSLTRLALHMRRNLDAYLSATQLGITFASLGLGWIGEPVVARMLMSLFSFLGLPLSPDAARGIALPSAFLLITTLHIVLGELAPKSIAIQYPRTVSLALAPVLQGFFFLFRPLISFLNGLSWLLLHALGLRPTRDVELHSAEELQYVVREQLELEPQQRELLENVLRFPQVTARQIMVPRTEIVAIERSMSSEQIVELFLEEGYSRMPVYEGTLDTIVGIVYARDVLRLLWHRNLIILDDIIRPAYFVPEEEPIERILRTMQQRHIHMAIVVDEFGGTAGLVTLEDVLEELVGEIQDEYDEESPPVQPLAANRFLVRATATVADVNELLPVPLPQSEEYGTVGGLITMHIGGIPAEQTKCQLGEYTCRILKTSKRRIEMVELELPSTVPHGDSTA